VEDRRLANGEARKDRGRAYLVAVTACLASCGYGPPVRLTNLENFVNDSSGSRTAVAYHYAVRRQATGLRAFPDGGVPKTLAEGVEVYTCDETLTKVTKRAVIPRPDELRTAFSGWVLRLRQDTIYLRLSGYVGNESSPSDARSSIVRIRPDGQWEATALADMPMNKASVLHPYCRRFVDSLLEASVKRATPTR
jgi:hypothetical protein